MKKGRKIRIFSFLLSVLMMLGCGDFVVLAEGEGSSIAVKDVYSLDIGNAYEEVTIDPGTTTRVKIPIVNNNLTDMTNFTTVISVILVDNNAASGFTIKNISLGSDFSSSQVSNIGIGAHSFVCFDVVAKDTIHIGQYFFTLDFISKLDKFTCNTLKVPFNVTKELHPAEMVVTKYHYNEDDAVIGNEIPLHIIVKNEGQIAAMNTYVSIDYGETGLAPGYRTKNIKLGDIKSTGTEEIKVPVKILKTATAGTKVLKATFAYKDASGNTLQNSTELYINIIANEKAPRVTINSLKYSRELKRGNEFKVSMALKNTGKSAAYDMKVSVDGLGTDSVVPAYTSDAISVEDLAVDEDVEVKIPLIISKNATAGVKVLTVNITYTDEEDVSYTIKTTVYPEVIVPEKKEKEEKKEEEEIKPVVIISNVEQSPEVPKAKKEVTLSFDLINKSDKRIKEVKIGPTNIAPKTFSPISSNPYQYFDVIPANSSQRVEMTFQIDKDIVEGLNTIEMQYTYMYGKKFNLEGTGSAVLNVVHVKNKKKEKKEEITVPKLIISNYYSDTEEIRAGSIFLFHYDIKNTSKVTTAKNIKVTVEQADNIFSITSGSNSFYISKIEPGETYSTAIELKVKADATTKTYPLDIKLEYEYEGAVANPTTGEIGMTVKNTINLQTIENTRAEVNNIACGDWTPPTVGEPSTLTLEFYNLGIAQLNNVYVTVSGDFEKQDGDKYFIGNVTSGGCEYVEMNVIPLVEGTANGVVTVYFEDSTAEVQTITKEFKCENIQSAMNPGGMPIDMYPGEIPPQEMKKENKAIVPWWVFLIIQAAILLIVTPVTRKIVIKRYRRKLEKQEEQE